MNEEQWVGKSLTAWGVVIAVLTGLIPPINLLTSQHGWTITPDWLHSLDTGVQGVIQAVGLLVSVVMIAYDRVSGGVKKTLVLFPDKNYTLEYAPKPKAVKEVLETKQE